MGVGYVVSQARLTSLKGKGPAKLYVQAVSHWNAKASLTHSQVIYDLNHTHALISSTASKAATLC